MVADAEFSRGKFGLLEAETFVNRKEFLTEFSDFVAGMNRAEEYLKAGGEGKRVVDWADSLLENLYFTPQERELFERTFNLFSIKHSLPPFSDFPEAANFLRGKGRQERSIEIGGPIAVSKTQLGKFLADQIGARWFAEGFEPATNPFCESSYSDDDFLLRSQLNFLLSSIEAGLNGKFFQGRWVRDSSSWSDIHVFMEWKYRLGQVNLEEYKTYMKLVNLLDPLITKPDLLIMLMPNSLDSLWTGFQKRIEAEPEVRQMERAITKEDLNVQIKATREAIEVLEEKGINVLAIEVDPVEIYQRPDLRYATVYRIRENLGILKEFLIRDPRVVAQEIVKIFASDQEPQVVIIHGKSMFTGKTSACNEVAEIIGPEKVLAFQPLAAIRYGDEHMNYMIDRDGRKTPGITIKSNRLSDIVELIDKEGITPTDKSIIFIDELMLFVESDKEEALKTIEELRSRGFRVVTNGLTYTFQELPFTFMHELLEETLRNQNWHSFEMGTRCKYCEKPARGTRRLKSDSSTAEFSDQAYEAGEHYEPVCCEEHPSCVNQPINFQRLPLPTKVI